MELVITEKEDDVSVRYRCDICDYNPYQAWCKGNVARFHAALMKHKQSARHREAEAFARGEQPVSISKDGKVSADAPAERPPHFYISKLETMIDKLNDRIDALNHLYEGSETSEENNPEKFGSLVGDFRHKKHSWKRRKSGELGTGSYLRIAFANCPNKPFVEDEDFIILLLKASLASAAFA